MRPASASSQYIIYQQNAEIVNRRALGSSVGATDRGSSVLSLKVRGARASALVLRLVRIVPQIRQGAGTSTDDTASIADQKNTPSFGAKGPRGPYRKTCTQEKIVELRRRV